MNYSLKKHLKFNIMYISIMYKIHYNEIPNKDVFI